MGYGIFEPRNLFWFAIVGGPGLEPSDNIHQSSLRSFREYVLLAANNTIYDYP